MKHIFGVVFEEALVARGHMRSAILASRSPEAFAAMAWLHCERVSFGSKYASSDFIEVLHELR